MTRSLIIRVDEVLKWSTGTCIHVAWPWPPPTLHSTVKRSDQFARAFITECWRARFAEYFRMGVHHQRNANTLIVSSMEQFSHTDKLEVRRICVICIVRTTSLQIPYFIISKTCIIASTTDFNYPFSFILISIFAVLAAHTHTHMTVAPFVIVVFVLYRHRFRHNGWGGLESTSSIYQSELWLLSFRIASCGTQHVRNLKLERLTKHRCARGMTTSKSHRREFKSTRRIC